MCSRWEFLVWSNKQTPPVMKEFYDGFFLFVSETILFLMLLDFWEFFGMFITLENLSLKEQN